MELRINLQLTGKILLEFDFSSNADYNFDCVLFEVLTKRIFKRKSILT